MHLVLYIDQIKIKSWKLNMPDPDSFLTDNENFTLRKRYVQEQVAAGEQEFAHLIYNQHYQFVIEVKASVQPADFDKNKELASAPVIKFQRPPAIYSRAKVR